LLSVGLTGGIGSGKSSVAQRFAELGAVIVDSDLIARQIVEPGQPALTEIAERFSEGAINDDGTLNRLALAKIVFNDPQALTDLNAIMHPKIAARSAQIVAEAPDDAVVVHDSPLLVEQDLADSFDVVVVVDCPDDIRLNRLVNSRGMAADDAVARMAAQANRDERLAVADFVIENSGSEGQLQQQTDAVWAELVEAAAEFA
jgi:dephospho-CoA kinase